MIMWLRFAAKEPRYHASKLRAGKLISVLVIPLFNLDYNGRFPATSTLNLLQGKLTYVLGFQRAISYSLHILIVVPVIKERSVEVGQKTKSVHRHFLNGLESKK